MTERQPMTMGYHHFGILAMSGVGLVLLTLKYMSQEAITATLVIPTLAVGAIMLVQLFLDYKYFEEDYYFYTSAKNQKARLVQLKERVKHKWPALLIIPLLFIFDLLAVVGAFFFFMIMTYPLQRKMYLKSQEEFGSSDLPET